VTQDARIPQQTGHFGMPVLAATRADRAAIHPAYIPRPAACDRSRWHLAAWAESNQGRQSAPELVFVLVAGVGFEPTSAKPTVLQTAWPEPATCRLASSRGESHPPALSEPCVNLSIYTAPIIQPFHGHGLTSFQWAKRIG
jgi:hypothetical protein